jgi:nicotinamidase-related amidase
MGKGLFSYPLTPKTVHLCLDMQRIFSPEGPWATPWMERVLPVVTSIASRYPERTVFTRFLTPREPTDMPGMWQRYYSRWQQTTRNRIDPALLELVSPLARLSPPATVIDKSRFSGFAEPQLFAHLQARDADGLVITGSETDVCVLATVLAAVDIGYRVIIVRDAICSSSDEGHEALMEVYHSRFTEQIETADADEILTAWE